MKFDPTAAPRPAKWKGAAALATVCAVALTSAATASANTYTPAPGLGTFASAVASANSNPGPDTIKLADGDYQYVSTVTITGDLTITSDHANQGQNGGATLDGVSLNPPNQDFLVVNPGVNVRIEGTNVEASSDVGFTSIHDKGNLELDNDALLGNGGNGAPTVTADTGSTLAVINTSINNNLGNGVVVTSSTVTLLNDDIAGNSGIGISQTGGTVTMENTIVADNTQGQCLHPPTTGSHNLASDASCGASAIVGEPGLQSFPDGSGGPTLSYALPDGSPAVGAGDGSVCPSTDQRFFVRHGACDIGSYQSNATQDTTGPSCVVTATNFPPSGPATQTVTGTDSGSGLGPDAFSNIVIDNGTVAAPTLTSVTTAGVPITATKTTPNQLTHWSFDLTDWAGNTTHCV